MLTRALLEIMMPIFLPGLPLSNITSRKELPSIGLMTTSIARSNIIR